jgi:hypothetical protein
MGGFVIMWLVGEGLVTYRWVRAGAPPTPGALALSSSFFALLGVMGAAWPAARPAVTLMAAGINVAALLQVLPGARTPQDTGWPPPMITDPTLMMQSGAAALQAGQSAGAGFATGIVGNVPGASSFGAGAAAGFGA